ncbi:MAG: hypothetical protein U1E23_14980 [Reyranellaceae bacterium]
MKLQINGGLVIYAVLAAITLVLIGAALLAAVNRAWPLLALALLALVAFAGLVWCLLHAWKA